MSTAGNKCAPTCRFRHGDREPRQQIQSDPANISHHRPLRATATSGTTSWSRGRPATQQQRQGWFTAHHGHADRGRARCGQVGAEVRSPTSVTRARGCPWKYQSVGTTNKFSYEVSGFEHGLFHPRTTRVRATASREMLAHAGQRRDGLIVAFVNCYSTNVEAAPSRMSRCWDSAAPWRHGGSAPDEGGAQTVRSEVYTIDGKRIEARQMGRGLPHRHATARPMAASTR